MFEGRVQKSMLGSGRNMLRLIYHNTVRSVRKTHGNALAALGINIMQSVIMVAVFYAMFTVLGLRGMAVRGDFLLYIMSGIFLFLTHIKAIGAVLGAEGATSSMMNHLNMNTAIAICSAALGVLYIQTLTVILILFFYNAGWGPIEIYDPKGAYAMLLLAWFTGSAIGMLFFALKPWAPQFVSILSQLLQRANMIASGKMFLANTLPAYMLAMFDWNPLFHTIDQARGFAFINYNPHFSSVSYPIYVGLACVTLGLMGEFYTRKHSSQSWNAKR
ncbi:ABC transporter permease [Ovoidimarina sediminis]|uniref:ABC transporter permease n=1 Tax=Ovoidimarina sediminis TaxID=3079856 RepID=UPI00290C68A8|nr:ABC transporter permease [Rhodophyticola sp. MJ-SS7]MDU8942402.1 ABC transporter permease [Rhodophyticola sp. MJ-SS7]